MSKISTRKPPATPGPYDRLHRDLATAVIAFHEAVAREVGMSVAERKFLGVLWDLKVATAGELANATGLTTGAITGIVDRLSAAGYAKREPNPDDRRSVLIRPLKEKELRKEIGPAFQSLTDAMADLRTRFSAAELKAIAAYLGGTIEVLRAETATLKSRRKAKVA